jgi:MOSC domain-containing protein YiiM
MVDMLGVAGHEARLEGIMARTPENGVVTAVSRNATHSVSKPNRDVVRLLTGLGVEGDAHAGETVKHRSRVARGATRPNLRQVHLIHSELFHHLRSAGFSVTPGDLGENITTRGIDLLALPVGSRLVIGDAVITLTGLRNPCQQINDFRDGLLKQVVWTDGAGNLIRLMGVMGIVSRGGHVQPGDSIHIELPPPPHHALTRV